VSSVDNLPPLLSSAPSSLSILQQSSDVLSSFRLSIIKSSRFIIPVGVSRPGGSLGRRVKCRRVPQPRWVGARPSAKGGERWPETGVREVEIPRPSCSSRAQVGCACSGGLQASTRERERAALRKRLSRPRPRAAHPL
jgi:hypothetical protein